jgi:hypothetical protein
MQTSSLFPDSNVPTPSPLAAGRIAGATKPTLLDKAWSSNGWKMARRAAPH